MVGGAAVIPCDKEPPCLVLDFWKWEQGDHQELKGIGDPLNAPLNPPIVQLVLLSASVLAIELPQGLTEGGK